MSRKRMKGERGRVEYQKERKKRKRGESCILTVSTPSSATMFLTKISYNDSLPDSSDCISKRKLNGSPTSAAFTGPPDRSVMLILTTGEWKVASWVVSELDPIAGDEDPETGETAPKPAMTVGGGIPPPAGGTNEAIGGLLLSPVEEIVVEKIFEGAAEGTTCS